MLRAPGRVVADPGEADWAGVLAPVTGTVAAVTPLGLAVEPPRAVDSVWLIEISCSRLFTFTNWLMYSLGSVSAVGSWFCISVTSRVRKSLAEMVAESLAALLELLVSFAAAAAVGLAVVTVRACADVW